MAEPTAPTIPPKGKSKEELLREETRFWMDILTKQMQWGLTLMVTIQTALVFIRRELLGTFIAGGILKAGDELPYHRYLVGTTFLIVAATMLWAFTNRSVQQYRHYKNQLLECSASGIKDLKTSGISKWIGFFYFAFPILDVAFRFWIEFTGIKVH
jgi:hypothetical protein